MERLGISRSLLIAIAAVSAGLGFLAGRTTVDIPLSQRAEQQPRDISRSSSSENPSSGHHSSETIKASRVSASTAGAPSDNSTPTASELGQLYASVSAAQAIEAPIARTQALRSIFARLSESSPSEALALAGTLDRALDRRTARLAVIESIATYDAIAAVEMANGLTDMEGRQFLLDKAIRMLALEQPEQALSLVPQLAESTDFRWSAKIYEAWAMVDGRSAMTHADSASVDKDERRNLRGHVFRAWLEADTDAAVGWFLSMAQSGGIEGMEWLTTSLMNRAPEHARQVVQDLPEGQMRRYLMQNLIETVAKTDPREAVSMLEGIDGAQDVYDYSRIASRWARTHPHEAINWANSLGPKQRRRAVESTLRTWISTDGEAALAFLELDENQALREMSSHVVTQVMHELEPVRALQWMLSAHGGEPQSDTLVALAHSWANTDPRGAVEAFMPYENEAWGQLALSTSIMRLATRDASAAQAAFDNLTNMTARQQTIDAIAQGWSSSNPAAALNWANELSAQMRDHALLGIVRGTRDRAQQRYELAQTIEDPQLRNDAIRVAIFAATQSDPELARQWLAANDLSPEYRRWIRRHTGIESD